MIALRYSLVLFAALLPMQSFAGAWLQEEGKGIAVLQATYFNTDEFFDDTGNRKSQTRFDKSEINVYGEYGLSEKLTIGANLFANYVEQGTEENYGLADSEFFLRTSIYETNAMVVSLQPLIKLPSEYENNSNLRGGSRSTDVELSALVGINQPIISNRDYLDLRAGYRERNRGLEGQWRLDATVGMYVSEDWLLTASARSVISDANPNNVTFREDGEQDYSQFKIEVGAQYALSEDYWLQLTGFQHVAGAQAGAGEGITIGIGMRF